MYIPGFTGAQVRKQRFHRSSHRCSSVRGSSTAQAKYASSSPGGVGSSTRMNPLKYRFQEIQPKFSVLAYL